MTSKSESKDFCTEYLDPFWKAFESICHHTFQYIDEAVTSTSWPEFFSGYDIMSEYVDNIQLSHAEVEELANLCYADDEQKRKTFLDVAENHSMIADSNNSESELCAQFGENITEWSEGEKSRFRDISSLSMERFDYSVDGRVIDGWLVDSNFNLVTTWLKYHVSIEFGEELRKMIFAIKSSYERLYSDSREFLRELYGDDAKPYQYEFALQRVTCCAAYRYQKKRLRGQAGIESPPMEVDDFPEQFFEREEEIFQKSLMLKKYMQEILKYLKFVSQMTSSKIRRENLENEFSDDHIGKRHQSPADQSQKQNTMTWKDAQRLLEKVCRRGTDYKSMRDCAELCGGCSTSTVQKAFKYSLQLQDWMKNKNVKTAPHAESFEGVAGDSYVDPRQIDPSLMIDDLEQYTEMTDDEAEKLLNQLCTQLKDPEYAQKIGDLDVDEQKQLLGLYRDDPDKFDKLAFRSV